MPPKKRTKKAAKAPVDDDAEDNGAPPCDASVFGSSENPANASKGLVTLPTELIMAVLSGFKPIGPLTVIHDSDGDVTPATLRHRHDRGPVLDPTYLARPRLLRALSQVCVAYRKKFLPLAYENLDSCVDGPGYGKMFFKHVGETLFRRCTGLMKRKDLAEYVGIANVCLTRYQTDTILPTFVSCLKALPNIHTIHVLHAHTQMTTPIRVAFELVSLPTIRTMIVPGYCHELVKSCPEVRSLRCVEDTGSKIIGVMAKNCKKVEEVRGFNLDDNMLKRLVKAAPNLRVLDFRVFTSNPSYPPNLEARVKLLKQLRHLSTIEMVIREDKLNLNDAHVKIHINAYRGVLKESSAEGKKYLKVVHQKRNDMGGQRAVIIDIGLE